MAAGAQKTYTALFQIGGKLLGSFKGAMQMAEMRLKRLHTAAKSMAGAMKGLGGMLATFASGLAGFTAGKVFSGMFSNAVEDAREVETRFKAIQVTMLKNAQLMRMAGGDRGKALELAKEQTDILMKHNDVLEKQGVLSDQVYASMERQMSIAGVPTKSILHSVDAMGDLLVAIKGVTANEEHGAELADAMMKAIFQGKTKQLVPWIGALPKDWWKDQIAQGKTYQDMLDDLLARMQFAKGANVRESFLPLGRIQRTENALKKMRIEIGNQMIPIQAEMADMWLKALPEIKPAIIPLFKGLMILMRKLAQFVIQYVIPAFVKLNKWWSAQTPAAQKRWLLIAAAIAGVAAALVLLGAVVVPVAAAIVAALTSPVTAVVAGVAATIVGMMVFWHYFGDTITAAASAVWDFLKAGWQDLTDFFTMLWDAVAPDLSAIWDDIKTIVSVFWDWLKVAAHDAIDVVIAAWHLIEPVVQPIFDKIKAGWQFIVEAFEKAKPTIINVLKEIGKVFLDWLLEPLRKFRWIFDKVAGAINRFRPAGAAAAGGPGGAAAQAAAAAAATAPAQAAATQMPLTPEGIKAVQAERASVIADLQRPEIRNLVSATLATEAKGAEDQKNVMEALVNRGVAQQKAGNYHGVEALIKGGFYGPYNRGETQAVMAKGLSDARSEQVKQMIDQIGAGRNALGGLTDQGMVNEIKGSIKEQHGEDYYGKLGIPGEEQTAAFRLSRGYAAGGVVMARQLATLGERGPEAVIPLSGGKRAEGLLNFASRAIGMPATHSTSVNFSPSVVIHGNATEAEQRAMDSRLRDLKDDFIKQFEQAQRQERRLSYEGGYA